MSTELWLQIQSSADASALVGIVDEAVIGRDLRCDVVVDDREVSRMHARLSPVEFDGWMIADLATKNGTYLNDELLVGPARLASGDVIRIGRATCRVVEPHPQDA